MGELIVNMFMSLDGVLQGPGAPDEDREEGFEYGGWQAPYFDEESVSFCRRTATPIGLHPAQAG
jgi:hypothetical protein